MIGKDIGVKSRSDGLSGVRFLVKACVIVSFLFLVTGYNYYVTGEVPDLWNAGEGVSNGADEVLTFARRKLSEEAGDECNSAVLKVQVDKCAFVRAQCPQEGFVDYLEFYYCTARNPAGWLLLIFLLLLYFYLLGGTAERFFCPALCRLSAGLKMSPNVAGVTLLAIGNGSPDIFSTIASVQQNLFGQAMGSLLGGGMFVTSVVVGSVTLASKGSIPKVTRRPFLRDIGFYLTAIIVIFFICWDGKIKLWESVFFILFYVSYVAVIIIGRIIYQKRKKSKIAKMALLSHEEPDAEKDEFEFVTSGTAGKSYDDYDDDDNEDDGLSSTHSHHQKGHPSPMDSSLIQGILQASSSFGGQQGDSSPSGNGRETRGKHGRVDKATMKERMAKRMADLGVYISKVGFWRNKTKNELKREVRMTMAKHHDHHGHPRVRQTVQRISDLPEDLTESDLESSMSESETLGHGDDIEAPPSSTRVSNAAGWGIGSIVNHQLLSVNNDVLESDVDDDLVDRALTMRSHAGTHGIGPGRSGINDDGDNVPLLEDTDDFQEAEYGWEDNIDDSTWSGAVKLNWRNLKEILEWDDAKTLKDTIFLFADMPRLFLQHFTIHFAEPDTYYRPFYVLQPLGIAILLLSCFGGWTLRTALPGPLSAWIMPLAILLCIIIYFTTKNDEPPIYEWGFICVGLLMSVLWIYFIAQELVALLSAAGIILRISNAIMGLTVLAWGNSIGDMVSNVVVSRKGFPQMALSACYASPLCTMVLGLGIALTIRLVKLRSMAFSLEDQLSNTVFWGFIFLIASLAFMMIAVPLSGFTFKKIYGFLLIGIYAAFTLISLLTEANLIFPSGFVIWDKWPGRKPN